MGTTRIFALLVLISSAVVANELSPEAFYCTRGQLCVINFDINIPTTRRSGSSFCSVLLSENNSIAETWLTQESETQFAGIPMINKPFKFVLDVSACVRYYSRILVLIHVKKSPPSNHRIYVEMESRLEIDEGEFQGFTQPNPEFLDYLGEFVDISPESIVFTHFESDVDKIDFSFYDSSVDFNSCNASSLYEIQNQLKEISLEVSVLQTAHCKNKMKIEEIEYGYWNVIKNTKPKINGVLVVFAGIMVILLIMAITVLCMFGYCTLMRYVKKVLSKNANASSDRSVSWHTIVIEDEQPIYFAPPVPMDV